MPVPTQTKTITVRINANGTVECLPHVTRIKPGGAIKWVGPPHSGVIRGRIPASVVPNPIQHNFTNAELRALHPQLSTTGLPFNQLGWAVIPGAAQPDDTILVNADAHSVSAYKYDVTVGSVTLDPVIIVDADAPDA